MKKIILDLPKQKVITLEDLNFELFNNRNNKIITYKRHSSLSYCLFAKLPQNKWGFVPFGELDSKPCFVGQTIAESLELVLKSKRDLRIFDSIHEFSKEVLAGGYQ